MSAPDLRKALRLVETLGLAPLGRVWNTRPKSYFGGAYDRWNKRRMEAEREVAERLGKEGAAISSAWDGARIRFAGVSASSTMGLHQALNNWKAGAERRLGGVSR